MAAPRLTLVTLLATSCAVGAEFDDEAGVDAATAPEASLRFDLQSSNNDALPLDAEVAAELDVTDEERAGADSSLPGADVTTVGPCARASSCGACTSFGGCGWCGGTNICVPGSSSGPTDGRCVTGWAFSSVTCINPTDTCDTLSGCGACLARSGCGWCGASSRCVTANAARNGPMTGSCTAMWAGEVAACNVGADPCVTRTDCGACTGTAGCGWCKSSNSCMSGSATGPATGRSCVTWAGLRSLCANLADSCNSSGNCALCTVRSDCGWCSDSDTCHSGSSSGPTDRACASSRWRWRSVLSCL